MLVRECGLSKKSIGSGTGFLAKLFLDYGSTVFGVEPNQAMREAAEVYLAQYYDFHSMLGTAEATRLIRQASISLLSALRFIGLLWKNPTRI